MIASLKHVEVYTRKQNGEAVKTLIMNMQPEIEAALRTDFEMFVNTGSPKIGTYKYSKDDGHWQTITIPFHEVALIG